jgi:hypothetical protein
MIDQKKEMMNENQSGIKGFWMSNIKERSDIG